MAETESKIDLTNRLQREGRWAEASAYKDSVIRESRKLGLTKEQAGIVAWRETARNFPPLVSKEGTEPASAPGPASMGESPSGSDTAENPKVEAKVAAPVPVDKPIRLAMPPEWGELPASAKFEVEVEWVYGNYSLIVEHRSNGNRIKLARAKSPAPSMAAIGLLEWVAESTTNRAAFYKDLVPKAKKVDADDDIEVIRRERKSIGEIEAILAKMEEAST